MEAMNTFIKGAAKDTGVAEETCNTVILSMVKAVNGGALGAGGNQMAQLSRLRKKRFTTTNTISDIVAGDTSLDRNEEVKPVVGWMVDKMIQTMDQGGMPALIRMVNLMKKGQQAQNKPVDYSDELKDINEMLDKNGQDKVE